LLELEEFAWIRPKGSHKRSDGQSSLIPPEVAEVTQHRWFDTPMHG
jgi:hypothetical protein